MIDLSDVSPVMCAKYSVLSPIYLRDPGGVQDTLLCSVGDNIWFLREHRDESNAMHSYFVHALGYVGYLVGTTAQLRNSSLIELTYTWTAPPDFNRIVAPMIDGDALERLAKRGT